MSERGTFVTSFLYDDQLRPLLRELLPAVCRGYPHEPILLAGPRDCFFAGLMHGGYGTEEAFEMEMHIEDAILPRLRALPEEGGRRHGNFEIVVKPEWEEATTLFSFVNGEVKVERVRRKE